MNLKKITSTGSYDDLVSLSEMYIYKMNGGIFSYKDERNLIRIFIIWCRSMQLFEPLTRKILGIIVHEIRAGISNNGYKDKYLLLQIVLDEILRRV